MDRQTIRERRDALGGSSREPWPCEVVVQPNTEQRALEGGDGHFSVAGKALIGEALPKVLAQ
jgi:hypothetical protein